MTLPGAQQHALNGIEDGLLAVDPQLCAMFSVFAQLTAGEDMPRNEQLTPPWWSPATWWRHATPSSRLRTVVLIPLLLATALSLLLISVFVTPSGGHRRCSPAAAAAQVLSRPLRGTAACPASSVLPLDVAGK